MDNSLEAFSSNPRYAPAGLDDEIEREEITEARRIDSEQAAVKELDVPRGTDIDMHEKLLNVVDTATRVPRDIVGGVTKAVDSSMALVVGRENLDAANEWLIKEMPALVSFTTMFEKGHAPKGSVSEVTQELSQFAIPFGAYMKGLKAISVGAGIEGGTFTQAFIADIAASGTALDPHMERLSTVARDMGIDNKVVGWMADNENETDSEGRLKNILENAGLGIAIAGALASVLMPMKGMWRLTKKAKKPIKKAVKKVAEKAKPKKVEENIDEKIKELLEAADKL